MPNPFFTVITVTYNSSQFVRDAIESVLASTFTDFELIIGDDCSTDNTWEIINEYNDPRIVKYRNETNLREYPNRNKALNMARGEWVIFIDGDDVIYEHGLFVFSEYLKSNVDISMLIQKNYLNNVIWPIKVEPKQFLINEFFGSQRLSCSSFASNVFRRDSMLELMGLSNDYKTGDEDFRLRMGSRFNTLFIAGWLTWPRETPGQASKSIKISTMLIERYNQINNLLKNDMKDEELDGIIINGAQSFQILIKKTWMNLLKKANFKEARVIYKYFGFKKSLLKPKKPLIYVDVLTSQSTRSPLKWKK
jgi:glycosyltransferase involved in cell wall biosynthesis